MTIPASPQARAATAGARHRRRHGSWWHGSWRRGSWRHGSVLGAAAALVVVALPVCAGLVPGAQSIATALGAAGGTGRAGGGIAGLAALPTPRRAALQRALNQLPVVSVASIGAPGPGALQLRTLGVERGAGRLVGARPGALVASPGSREGAGGAGRPAAAPTTVGEQLGPLSQSFGETAVGNDAITNPIEPASLDDLAGTFGESILPAVGTGDYPEGVACPAPGSCIAVGRYTPSGGGFAPLVDVTGGTTAQPPSVTAVSPGYGPTEGNPVTVTITGSGFTGATAVTFGGTNAGFQVVSDSVITATPPMSPTRQLVDVRVTGPNGESAATAGDEYDYVGFAAVPTGGQLGRLQSVSCFSRSSCLAVGYDRVGGGDQALVERFSGSSFSPVAPPSIPGSSEVDLTGVSCTFGVGQCMVVGWASVSGAYVPVAAQYASGSWTVQALPSYPSSLAEFLALSCSADSGCVAVGYQQDQSCNAGSSCDSVIAATFDGTTWSASSALDAVTAAQSTGSATNHLLSVSCTSLTDCTAVGEDSYTPTGQPAQTDALVEHFDGSVWSIETNPDASASTSPAELVSVSCPSTDHCTASGGSGSGALLLTGGTGGWSPDSSANPGWTSFGAVGCDPGGTCTVLPPVWSALDALSSLTPSGPAAFGPVVTPVEGDGGDGLLAVSCPAVADCVAVGDYQTGNVPANDYPLAESEQPAPFAPQVVEVTPASGPSESPASTAQIQLSGVGFTGATQVLFGSQPAASMSVSGDSSIYVTAPAGSDGTVDVTVVGPGGTSATSAEDRYGYTAVVTGVSPPDGAATARTPVTVSGRGFTGETSVTLSCVAGSGCGDTIYTVSGVQVASDSELSFTFPDDADLGTTGFGAYDIVVSSAGGPSPASSFDQFSLLVAPVVDSLATTAGAAQGGTSVLIDGQGFTAASAVLFGTVPAASFSVTSDGQLEAVSPPGTPGQVEVTVQGPVGTSTAGSVGADLFTYYPQPVIDSVQPPTVPAWSGGTVTLTGSGFADVAPDTAGPSVYLAGYLPQWLPVSAYTVNSDTSMTVAIPPLPRGALADTGAIVVQDGGVLDQNDSFSTDLVTSGDDLAFSPVVSGLSPPAGSPGGGGDVVVEGSGLGDATEVDFGSVPAPAFSIVSDDELLVTAPAGLPTGSEHVTVQSPAGPSSPLVSGEDLYFTVAPPGVQEVQPGSGSPGLSVVITGSGFLGATAVDFTGAASGDLPAAFSVVSASQIDATVPAGSGSTSVLVTGPGGTSAPNPGATFAIAASGGSVLLAAGQRSGSSAGGGVASGSGGPGATGSGSPGAPAASGGGPSLGARPPGTRPGRGASPGSADRSGASRTGGLPIVVGTARLERRGARLVLAFEMACRGLRRCVGRAAVLLLARAHGTGAGGGCVALGAVDLAPGTARAVALALRTAGTATGVGAAALRADANAGRLVLDLAGAALRSTTPVRLATPGSRRFASRDGATARRQPRRRSTPGAERGVDPSAR